MSHLVSRYKRRCRLDAVRAVLAGAAAELSDLLLSEDTRYATQEAAWQEGPDGAQHCRGSEKLRHAIAVLQGVDLPDAGELG